MLLGRFFINKDGRRMELNHLVQLDERIVQDVNASHEGITIVYLDKDG